MDQNSMNEEQVKDEFSEREQRRKEFEDTFSYDGYQVVRKELFAHLRDPAVTIRRDSVTFNTACINGLEDVVYIQIEINSELKRMVIRGCGENDKDALRWCIAKPDKRKSRKMTGQEFSSTLYKRWAGMRIAVIRSLATGLSLKGKRCTYLI